MVASSSVTQRVIHVYHDRQVDWIAEPVRVAAPEREVRTLCGREALAEALPAIEVLFASSPPRTGWARADKLRLIQILGVGCDMLLPSPDLPAAVEIAGLRGEFAPEVAEHAVAMMLALEKDLPHWHAEQSACHFRQRPVPRLAGKTCVVLGLGAVGRRVARVAAAMDMSVIGVRRRVDAEGVPDVARVVSVDELDRVLPRADVLVIAVPRTPATEGLFDAARLARLPRGARLVNVGRGGIVDESAVAELLHQGHLAGAAMDVFATEPLPADSPLWTAPGSIVTPHIAGLGEGYVARAVEVLLDNVARLERGEPRLHLVDRARGY